MSTDKLATHEAKTLQRDVDNINKRDEEIQKKRQSTRKQKEMEAKLF